MGVSTGDYDERVALEPWHYGGPEHVDHVPHVAVVDGDGLLVDVEDGLGGQVALGQPWQVTSAGDRSPHLENVAVSARSPLRAVLVHRLARSAPGTVRLRTLGCMELEDDDSCGRWLGQRTGDLLKFLVCRRYRVVHAQDIAEALWGHGGFVSSGTVRQCVHDLREKLDAGGREVSAQLVLTRQCGYALSHAAVVDADDFAVHVRRGIAALEQGRQEIATVHLRCAVAMYRGDFLSDEPRADWARLERERLCEHMEDALGALADVYLAAGDMPATTSCLRRLAEMLPHDDEVHRRLLAVLLAQGNHSHAWRCYQVFCDRLSRDFARPPGFTLAELAPEN
jgi:DNA-binding SARP family transcriptional activator